MRDAKWKHADEMAPADDMENVGAHTLTDGEAKMEVDASRQL